jgi:hypothetical protein
MVFFHYTISVTVWCSIVGIIVFLNSRNDSCLVRTLAFVPTVSRQQTTRSLTTTTTGKNARYKQVYEPHNRDSHRSATTNYCRTAVLFANTSPTTTTDIKHEISNTQRDFVMGYMNKHHTSFNIAVVQTFSAIGTEISKANAWSGGSYIIQNATFSDISLHQNYMIFNVTIRRRSQSFLPEYRHVQISLDADPIRPVSSSSSRATRIGSPMNMAAITKERGLSMIPTTPIDDLVRKLCRLCHKIPEQQHIVVTGKLIQLAIQLNGIGIGKLPDNMYVWKAIRAIFFMRNSTSTRTSNGWNVILISLSCFVSL